MGSGGGRSRAVQAGDRSAPFPVLSHRPDQPERPGLLPTSGSFAFSRRSLVWFSASSAPQAMDSEPRVKFTMTF
ncbi:hypothetical protein chiPu_0022412 [Chiloscyllium punctatum]|uniref:Uncharacterized protein n=1 Tax=Chiloscyllium punctatum TaxID=137246 RepID=A0A401RDU9_CHIPU|nr:hypothetical protein [Chiloscyllium punctatum]